MKALVLGAGGLLGKHLCAYWPDAIGLNKYECDITNGYDVYGALHTHKPDVVVNCAGITDRSSDTSLMYAVNTIGPRTVARACWEFGNTRLIHISTDCVFDGRHGPHLETDTPDAQDAYGFSKACGEELVRPFLILRTSFVGYPDSAGRGLLHWFFKTDPVDGYTNVKWNGLTTLALAKYIIHFATTEEMGIRHR